LVWSRMDKGGGGLTSRFPWLFLDWLFYEIPHSCLEYGTGVTSWKRDFFSHVYGWVVHGSPEPGQVFLWLIKAKFSYFFIDLYVDLMVVISLIFIWFYVGYKHSWMIVSCHGYFIFLLVTIKWMDERPNWWCSHSMENEVLLLVMFHKLFQSFMLSLVSSTCRLHWCQVFDRMSILVGDDQA